MRDITSDFLPPQTWQEFEKFLKGLVDVIWKQEGWQIYGRPGQSQSGIDLFGYDDKRRFTAIQAKKTSQFDSDGKILSKSSLTETLLRKEVSSAEKIKNPKLERLIFATTALRDTKVQDIVRKINDEHEKQDKFRVDIWFWEDFQIFIEQHSDLMYFYYSHVLKNILKYDKNIHVLQMLRRAFSRPAFDRPMHYEENGADFIEAIKATMEALTTGKLYNRRGELITTSFDYQSLSNSKWRLNIRKVLSNLNEIRNIYQEALLNKSIREHPMCLELLDYRISEQFNELRKDCLLKMNEILKEASLEKIHSELLN